MSFFTHHTLFALGLGCLLICAADANSHESSTPLTQKKCIPCSGLIPPLHGEELLYWKEQIDSSWEVVAEHHLDKDYLFEDFVQALEFANRVGAIAEEEGHHPVIVVSYGNVKVVLWTHKVDGLTESDFIMAAKIDALL